MASENDILMEELRAMGSQFNNGYYQGYNQALEDVQIELCVYGDGNPKTCICSNCSRIEELKKSEGA